MLIEVDLIIQYERKVVLDVHVDDFLKCDELQNRGVVIIRTVDGVVEA